MEAGDPNDGLDGEKIKKILKRSAEHVAVNVDAPAEDDDAEAESWKTSHLSSIEQSCIDELCAIEWEELDENQLQCVPGFGDKAYRDYNDPQSWLVDNRNPLANRGRSHLGL